ncbi:hypothetical protein WJX77_007314 [Trebouxia sp. C0004]
MASRRAFHLQAFSSLTSIPPPANGAYNRHRRRNFAQFAAATQHKEAPTKPVGRLILLDAFALLYRAHFGWKDVHLNAKTGEDTSILFAFVRTVFDLLELEPPPTHFAVVFDAAGHTFRHEMFPLYKAQRTPTPPAVTEGARQVRDLIRIMGIPEIIIPGVEADDAIGTLAIRGLRDGFHVAIASPDKDFFQLLQPGLQLLRPPKKDYKGPLLANMVPYTAQSFTDEWGMQPSQFRDYLALAGDAVDNVPGAKGIGPKTATQLIQQYGDIDSIMAHAHEHSLPRVRTKLTTPEVGPQVRLCKKLVTIQTDVDLPPLRFPMDFLALQPPSHQTKKATKTALEHYDFVQHAKRLDSIWGNMQQTSAGKVAGEASGWHSAVKPASELVQS